MIAFALAITAFLFLVLLALGERHLLRAMACAAAAATVFVVVFTGVADILLPVEATHRLREVDVGLREMIQALRIS